MTSPEGSTFPLSEFPENVRKLRGFIWREDERPKTKDEIFIKDTLAPIPVKKEPRDMSPRALSKKIDKEKATKKKSFQKEINEE